MSSYGNVSTLLPNSATSIAQLEEQLGGVQRNWMVEPNLPVKYKTGRHLIIISCCQCSLPTVRRCVFLPPDTGEQTYCLMLLMFLLKLITLEQLR